MIEKHIILENIDPVIFYGVNNSHLQMIRSLYPALKVTARDNIIRISGNHEDVIKLKDDLMLIQNHILKHYFIADEDILNVIKGKKETVEVEKVIAYSISGKPIKGRSQNQQRLVDAFYTHDMVFAVGPAGTGKTYISIALAVKALKEKAVKKIILSRPAVEAGEKLGFLPGDMKDKIDPYLQPLYDALEDMIPTAKLRDMIEKHIVQIAPLAFMRGRTLSDAIVILDEAQNTTPQQIRMFLTRMGWNTKMIITGDMTQIDLPQKQKSGLREALQILRKLEGVCVINLTPKDIVRHKLVTQIVNAYDAFDKQRETEQGVQKQRIANIDSSTSDNDDSYTIFENTDNDFN
ncbi:PhoH family protein [Segatella maculosa]|uniref:PhoH family protein n=1 Tax=Segatella maculosa TaxID=439703 RepID=UPI00036122B4|nr:PhoH family protein [Segatella maculosa]